MVLLFKNKLDDFNDIQYGLGSPVTKEIKTNFVWSFIANKTLCFSIMFFRIIIKSKGLDSMSNTVAEHIDRPKSRRELAPFRSWRNLVVTRG
jgi:hypothetical protein